MNVKCAVTLDDRDFLIKVPAETSVAALQHKIRTYLKISPEEAVFLFFEYNSLFTTHETLHAGIRLMGQIRDGNGLDIQKILVCRENTFGTWARVFVKGRVEERRGVYVALITYSYFSIYPFDDVSVHDTLHEAQEHLLRERCNGCLSLVQPKKE